MSDPMREAFERCSIDYYGAETPVCRLANISEPAPGELLVRSFDPDPDVVTALAEAGSALGLGWTLERARSSVRFLAKPTVPDVLPEFRAYLTEHSAWGALHIVLDDYNVTDDSVRFCIASAQEAGDAEGERLAGILLRMSKTQRLKLAHQAAEA